MQIQKKYNITYNIGRAALEQAYGNLCRLGSTYIHINPQKKV